MPKLLRAAAPLLCSLALLAPAACGSAPPAPEASRPPAARPAASPSAAAEATASPPAASRSAAGSSSCPVTPVRTDRLPAGLGIGFTDPAAPPPWMGDDRFAAVLFYAAGGDATMAPGGTMPDGRSTKILWMIRDADGPLTIRGTEARGGGFTQEVQRADQPNSYPSIVNVPREGCWTLTAELGGRAVGSITVPVA